jgi:hypothetical protein
MRPLPLVVPGTTAFNPYTGTAFMPVQTAGDLRRPSHDVYSAAAAAVFAHRPKTLAGRGVRRRLGRGCLFDGAAAPAGAR